MKDNVNRDLMIKCMEEAKATITKEKSLEIVEAVRMFLGSLPLTSTYKIPQDCETVLDLLTYFKYPVEQVILYILPTVQTIESILGEDNER